MSKRNRSSQPNAGKQNNSNETHNKTGNNNVLIIGAVISAAAIIIAALISYFGNIAPTSLTIQATQTAEEFHTSVAMTQTTEALGTSMAVTQTASVLETSIAMAQATDALEASMAAAQTADALETSTAMTKTAEALKIALAMTNQAAKPPTNTPLPPSSYGGLAYGCIPTAYWQLDFGAASKASNCLNLSKWGLYSDAQLLRIDIDNSNVIEKTLSMNISDFKDADISFSLVVKDMRGNPEKTTPRLAIGICEPNRPQFEHEFVYYDLSDNKLASAITINGFGNKDKYYFYYNEVRDYRLEVRSYDLSIYTNSISLNAPITIKRTDNTSFCLYYFLPEGSSLHSVIDKILIEKK